MNHSTIEKVNKYSIRLSNARLIVIGLFADTIQVIRDEILEKKEIHYSVYTEMFI